MTELPSKQPDDQRSEAERQLEYKMANLEVEVARLRAVNRRLGQALRAAGRVLEPYVNRSAA
jgi:hypothetical protein